MGQIRCAVVGVLVGLVMLVSVWGGVAGVEAKAGSKETLEIKSKLETAEQRVRELTSKLDTVSSDAGRARQEIHSTLMEAWRVVDMLGQDRCGEVGEKFRKAQLKAEAKVVELQDELKVSAREVEGLKVEMVKRESAALTLQNELRTERSRRETLEAEVTELRDKLHWASAVSNDTKSYGLVAERLQALIVIISERAHLLTKIQEMINEAQRNSAEWREETSEVSKIIRDAERDFAHGTAGAASETMRRHAESLERRLNEALANRDAVRVELNKLRKSADSKKRHSRPIGPSSDLRRFVESNDSYWASMNSIGFWTLVLVTFCCGMLLARCLSLWQGGLSTFDDHADAPGTMGYTPGKSPGRASTPSPGFRHSPNSPLQYVGDSATREATPRRY